MKKKLVVLIAIVLVSVLLMQTAAFAAPPGYVFPNNWSRNALIFAVENGILKGDANQNLHPSDSMTRAEMATVLSRLLLLQDRADLSRFSDVKQGAWYIDDMSKAVAAGIFQGTDATHLAPNAPITREQTMVVLCRAFGMRSVHTDSYLYFYDCNSISGFARTAIGTFRELGLVNGSGDRTVRPKNQISRAEVAQFLYNMFDVITDSADALPGSGRVLYRGEALPDGYSLDGTLFLTESASHQEVSGLSVSGYLIAAQNADLKLTDCDLGSVLLGKENASLFISGSIGNLLISGTNAFAHADASNLYVQGAAGARVEGSYCTALVNNSELSLSGSVELLHAAGSGSITLDGRIQECSLTSSEMAISGGSIDDLTSYVSSPHVDSAIFQTNSRAANGLSNTRLTVTWPATLTHRTETAAIAASIADKDALSRLCTLTWYSGRQVLHTQELLLSGGNLTESLTQIYDLTKPLLNLCDKVVLRCGDNVLEKTGKITFSTYWQDYTNARTTVRTANVPVRVDYNCRIYRYRDLTGVIHYANAGDTLYNEYNPLTGELQVSIPSTGQVGWVNWDNVSINYNAVVSDGSHAYSKGTAEGFVDAMGYPTGNGYLLWISKYTQRVYVFKGYRGDWTLVKTFLCCSGSNRTPTPRGVYETEYQLSHWYFDDYYVYNPVVFHGGHAFHSITYNYDGTVQDGTLGKPRSHGCIRMAYNDCCYIADLPLGATVVVY